MSESTNPLEQYFFANEGRRVSKWHHYFDAYHRHFARFRGTAPVVIEFGVNQGGSLRMWRDYFGPEAQIHGVDIDPRCAELEEPGTRIHIGDQEDRAFLASVMDETGPVDVLIEDGGHEFGQQIATFEVCYPRMAGNGVFLIEDLHTSYLPRFGGGIRQRGTFIQYTKNLVDQLHAWHSRQPRRFRVDDFTRTTTSMHVYDGIVVFERGPHPKPESSRTGHATTHDESWTGDWLLDGTGRGSRPGLVGLPTIGR